MKTVAIVMIVRNKAVIALSGFEGKRLLKSILVLSKPEEVIK